MDKDFFKIENGILQFKTPVDFEMQSIYSVVVVARDAFGNPESKTIEINVQNGKDQNYKNVFHYSKKFDEINPCIFLF